MPEIGCRVRWSAELADVPDDVLHRAVPGELGVIDDCAVAEPYQPCRRVRARWRITARVAAASACQPLSISG